jgi:hypothetical protein
MEHEDPDVSYHRSVSNATTIPATAEELASFKAQLPGRQASPENAGACRSMQGHAGAMYGLTS